MNQLENAVRIREGATYVTEINYITPRYTTEQVNEALAPHRVYIAQLETELAQQKWPLVNIKQFGQN